MSSFAGEVCSSTMGNEIHSGPATSCWWAAGCEHHFEDLSDDLALWRVFYGPSGGEVPEQP